MESAITAAVFILLGITIFGMVLLIALWNSLKRTYNSNGHEVPLNMRVGTFGIGCCIVVIPLYVLIHLMTLG